jgi:hypothetical protein
MFVTGSGYNHGVQTFSGDDSGWYGVQYVSDTSFSVDEYRGGDLCAIWGIK